MVLLDMALWKLLILRYIFSGATGILRTPVHPYRKIMAMKVLIGT